MSKVIIRVGYNDYVMEINDAVAVMDIMSKAEMYKVQRDYNAKPSTVSYHVWDQDAGGDTLSAQLLPDAVYRVAKLAGRPNDS